MTIKSLLKDGEAKLTAAGIGTARLDTLVLLEDITGKGRGWLLAHSDQKLDVDIIQQLKPLLSKRINHEPLAYVRGKTEFYGRDFMVDKRVLEPRPESETMIELLKKIVKQTNINKDSRPLVVDVGTGSGALAITTKLELPSCQVIGIDNAPDCLTVANQNAKKHKVNVQFLEGDLLEPIMSNSVVPFALLCNLPYVPNDFHVNQAAMHEPRQAIFGGADGLDLYRRLFQQLHFKLKPRYILTESLPFQHEKLHEIAGQSSYSHIESDDFIQLFQSKSLN